MQFSEYLTVIKALRNIIRATEWEGHVYSVGGCERDRIANREIKDIDIVVDTPNGGISFAKWLHENGMTTNEPVTYEHFGTAMFHLKDIPSIEVEAVQTRKECYRDIESRDPETAFGTIEDDCTRRDFTYNAIYYNISKDETCDFNGHSLEDLRNNIIRTCGNPDVIFSEDPLRILRAIRFQSRFGSTIDPDTYEGMKRNAERLNIISRERVQKELDGILSSDNPDIGFKMLSDVGVLHIIFPNFRTIDESSWNVFVDNYCKVIRKVNSRNPIINLAVLLRQSVDYLADLKSLKYSNDVIDRVMFLRKCSTYFPFSMKFANVSKFHHQCGTFSNFIDVCTYMESEIKSEPINDVRVLTANMIKNHISMFNYKLPVNGFDVMEVKGVESGKHVKDYLDLLLEVAYINPFLTKEECENILKAN